jgi:2-polyprenyl-3-methyl-5-hydroxy-6-metoxy-1,4-benzoquinol methylase
MTTVSTNELLAKAQRTVQSYEGSARHYNTLCDKDPPPFVEGALRRMLQCVPAGGSVLEIGSGPGRDADFVESLGAVVRRTDATQAFLDLQAERGKKGDLLNVVTDELGGPYDAVLAMCVLIHVDREQMDVVLRKVLGSLKPGGAFLVSMRKGEGETGGDYHTVYWTRDGFAARLAAVGLAIQWDMESVDSDNDEWLTFLARSAS